MTQKIYIIEDEQDILELISEILTESGYEVEAFLKAENMLQHLIPRSVPELFIIDLMLPGLSGLELCKILKNREDTKNIPIIFLTARGEEFDELTGFNMGCDDYITKPFSEKILLARISALFNRVSLPKTEDTEHFLRFKDLFIDPLGFDVYIKNKIINLTQSEFKILFLLFKNSKRAFTREQLIQNIRIFEDANERSIDTIIARIRKKLGSYGKYIKTVYGIGYKFSMETEN